LAAILEDVPWNTLIIEFAVGLLALSAVVLQFMAARRSNFDPELRDETDAAIAEALDVLGLPDASKRPPLIVHNGLSATRR